MKAFACLTTLIWLPLTSWGKPEILARTEAFTIEQDYSENRGVSERIVFSTPSTDAVKLPAYHWKGIYHLSPDGRSLLRIQKTGSGDNIAILYSVDPSGRVSEVIGFDDLIWKTSDKHSANKRAQLYHTGVSEVNWAADGKTLSLTLGGSIGDGLGHSAKILYHPAIHTCEVLPDRK